MFTGKHSAFRNNDPDIIFFHLQAIELNAFLQSEVDEKEVLAETVQRLKDETRG